MKEKILSLDRIGMCYRRNRGIFGKPFWALKNISFNLYQGETLGVIGRNGAGKSTLLQLMAGIIKPDRGEFVNYGYQVSLLSLRLGFATHLTGRENAILSGMLMGMSKLKIKSKMEDIIEFSELGEFIDQPVATYSSGMNARLGFSVAFQINPDILLIDEVLGVGDAEFRIKSTQAMRERIKTDKTIVLVSHNAAVIQELCHRAIWIDKGESLIEGNAEDVLKEYKKHLNAKKVKKS